MAGGVSMSTFSQRILTGGRRRVSTQASQGKFGETTSFPLDEYAFPHLLGCAFRYRGSGTAFHCVRRRYLGPRIWNEGISVVIADLLSAYSYYWHQVDAQAQLAFGSPLSWTRALDIDRDPTDCFKDFGRALLQAFRMQTMITSGPSIPLS
ncbi:putative dynein heavy chain [Trypanosoma cruzi]|nr:putative dynein heavy chain [Trypanosoma cruzi]